MPGNNTNISLCEQTDMDEEKFPCLGQARLCLNEGRSKQSLAESRVRFPRATSAEWREKSFFARIVL